MHHLARCTLVLGTVWLLTACTQLVLPDRRLSLPTASPSVASVRLPILMYHYISVNPNWPNDRVRTGLSVPPKQFAAQLRTSALLPAKPVILTFDDGYEDFYTNAYPLLKRYHAKATIYIISQKVGRAGYLTWPQLRTLAASPLLTIGAHTHTHASLVTLTAQRSWAELAGSKSDLEQQLGIQIEHLAYPAGAYNQTTIEQARQIGFTTAVTTHEGLEHDADQLLVLTRVRVNGGATLADLMAGLTGQRTRVQPTPVTGRIRRRSE
jgi:peptidoglycan/xylan/chitin deacetylase (PgdA/CDA1 family)